MKTLKNLNGELSQLTLYGQLSVISSEEYSISKTTDKRLSFISGKFRINNTDEYITGQFEIEKKELKKLIK